MYVSSHKPRGSKSAASASPQRFDAYPRSQRYDLQVTLRYHYSKLSSIHLVYIFFKDLQDKTSSMYETAFWMQAKRVAGEGNWLRRLRIANEIQCTISTLHDNNVTQFTVKHSSNINATTRLSNRMTCLLIITLVHSPTPSQIPHTLFDIISLSMDAVI